MVTASHHTPAIECGLSISTTDEEHLWFVGNSQATRSISMLECNGPHCRHTLRLLPQCSAFVYYILIKYISQSAPTTGRSVWNTLTKHHSRTSTLSSIASETRPRIRRPPFCDVETRLSGHMISRRVPGNGRSGEGSPAPWDRRVQVGQLHSGKCSRNCTKSNSFRGPGCSVFQVYRKMNVTCYR